MRAAVVSEPGSPPSLAERPEPTPATGDVLVEVEAVALNPVDIAVGAGRHYAGHPPLPYVPGAEAVGRIDGRPVWAFGDIGMSRDGGLAERVAVPRDQVVEMPEGADPAVAAALGIAGLAGWMPVAWRAPVREGETVLVLGATGAAGLVAVQAARLLGAGRVVVVGRDPDRLARAEQLGAAASVRIAEGVDLVAALREACGGDGPNLVVDFLWAEPARAATEAAARGARIVQVGQSAGPEATLTSAAIRGKQLEVLGYSNFAVPRPVLAAEYRRLVEHAVAGQITVDVERVPLERVADAWRRQAAGEGGKQVIVLQDRG